MIGRLRGVVAEIGEEEANRVFSFDSRGHQVTERLGQEPLKLNIPPTVRELPRLLIFPVGFEVGKEVLCQ